MHPCHTAMRLLLARLRRRAWRARIVQIERAAAALQQHMQDDKRLLQALLDERAELRARLRSATPPAAPAQPLSWGL